MRPRRVCPWRTTGRSDVMRPLQLGDSISMIRVSRLVLAAAFALTLTADAGAQGAKPKPTAADRTLSAIRGSPGFKTAMATLDAQHDRIVAETIELTEIPAPPFKEKVRGEHYLAKLKALGLSDVEMDPEGNVMGLRRGTGPAGGPVVVVAAHLDTVFPEGTDVKVKREGNRLSAPGVGDDSAGLATLLAIVDAMNAGRIQTRRDILFVGNVGEEGAGDLRGTRYLFNKGAYKGRIGAFFSLDGGGTETITNRGTGSKRYRITYKGPGGHSYGAFGIVNPLVPLAATVSELYKLNVPADPKTTYSASVIGGGTSVNAIPNEVWLEVDMRSASAAELAKLEQQFLDIVGRTVAAENGARSVRAGKISADIKPIGDRPAGHTAPDADIVAFARAAYRAEGIQ